MSYPEVSFCTDGLEKDLPMVNLDKERMNRVFTNLISNAVAAFEKEMPGRVEFRTYKMNPYNMVRIEVADNGSGIPDKLKKQVLEPYFSTKKEGTGLGLAIVNQVITDHGGYLRILDNEPGGTVMTIELPLNTNDA